MTESKVQKEGMCVAVGAAGHQSRKQEKEGMKPGRAETTLQKQPKGKTLDMEKKYPTGKSLQGAGEKEEKGKKKINLPSCRIARVQ